MSKPKEPKKETGWAEMDAVMRGLVRVPKTEIDRMERRRKKRKKGKK